MPKIGWKSVVLGLLVAFFGYTGAYLMGHDVKAYERWGYPPWAHGVAGVLFLLVAILLSFRQPRRLGALAGCCVLAPATATCSLHGYITDVGEGVILIVLVVSVAGRARSRAAA